MSKESRIVLGLDGGGTKTVCVAVPTASVPAGGASPDVVARIAPVGRVVVGSTNWNSVGLHAARANLEQAIERTLAEAKRTTENIDTVCLGMSGVDRPEDHAQLNEWLREMLPGIPAVVHNDAVVALASGTGGDLYGVVLISGTGMIAMGFNRAGERRRAGGWGALLGDGGSGYAIGSDVLRAVTSAADGRAPATSLTDATLEHLGLAHAQALVRWAYDDISWHRIARLAPLALSEASAGDPQAIAIVRHASVDLALAAESVARRLGIQSVSFPLVLAGGGLQEGILSDSLTMRFHRTLPKATVVFPATEPAIGAALLAIQHHQPSGTSDL